MVNCTSLDIFIPTAVSVKLNCICYVKVFEFLEEMSASLTDLAARELKVLKDFKVNLYL